MKSLFIYIDAPKQFARIIRVITPSEKFDGSWLKLVEAITGSNIRIGIKKYNSFEVI